MSAGCRLKVPTASAVPGQVEVAAVRQSRDPVATHSRRPLIDPASEQPAPSFLQDARHVFQAIDLRRADDDGSRQSQSTPKAWRTLRFTSLTSTGMPTITSDHSAATTTAAIQPQRRYRRSP